MNLEKVFPQHNLRVVNLVELIRKKVDIELVNDLHFYQLLESRRITKDIHKLFYHHTASAIMNYLVSAEGYEKCVFVYNPDELTDLDLFKYLPTDKIKKEFLKVIHHITGNLPIKIYWWKLSFKQAMWHIYECTGEGKELSAILRKYAEDVDDHYTFAAPLKYTLDNQLSALQKLLSSPSRNKLMMV